MLELPMDRLTDENAQGIWSISSSGHCECINIIRTAPNVLLWSHNRNLGNTCNLLTLLIHRLETTVGIMTACVPTLKPLFNKPLHHPWSSKDWTRTLSGVKIGYEDTDRLHNRTLNLHELSTPQVAKGRYDSPARNLVEIEGGWKYAGASGLYTGSTNERLDRGEGEGIRKITEFTLEVSRN